MGKGGSSKERNSLEHRWVEERVWRVSSGGFWEKKEGLGGLRQVGFGRQG